VNCEYVIIAALLLRIRLLNSVCTDTISSSMPAVLLCKVFLLESTTIALEYSIVEISATRDLSTISLRGEEING
jgi:hypothetical protein